MPIGKEYTPFGRYVLIERLAVGGMAEVFLARERGDSQRTVVVKRMHAGSSTDEDARARFLDESKLATLFAHPNIVRVHDVGMHDGAYYMALEWLLGWELREIIDRARERSKPLPVPIALKLARDAARGLAAAHGFRNRDGTLLDLVHRDVSPRNLFVTADGVLKILDFGVAKSNMRSRQTQARMVVGTYGYMAPEQLRGMPVDQRTDVFSLGAVLHELLTGERLFARPTMDAMVAATLEAPIPPPVRFDEALGMDIVTVVMRALQRNVDARYPSAAAFESALHETLSRIGEPTDQEVADTMTDLFQGSGAEPKSAGTQQQVTKAHVAVSHWADELGTASDAPKAQATPRRTADLASSGASAIPPKRSAPMVVAVPVLVVVALGVAVWRWTSHAPPEPRATPAAVIVPEPSTALDAQRMDAQRVDELHVAEPRATVQPPASAPDGPITRDHAPVSQKPERRRPAKQPRGALQKTAQPEPEPTPAPAPTRATGRLTLDARPWANVYMGSELLGATPLVERVLPAGRVQLRLVDPVSGREQLVTVDIPAGGDVRRVIKREP